MNERLSKHYRAFSTFTNPGCYREFLQDLPDNISELGNLVCHQIIHRVTLEEGNTNANSDLRYGDMDRFPWYRLRCDDDVLTNAVSMIAELLRLDDRGFRKDRRVEDKIVVTCRYMAILMASILKSKNIPCRVRSGFAHKSQEGSWDHWIDQYWNADEERWITFDADGFYDSSLGFDQFDMPHGQFDWAASSWLGIRQGKLDAANFFNASGFKGIMPVFWSVLYDFHCLMNNEILYLQGPRYVHNKFHTLTEEDFEEVDALAELMLDPDGNFDNLVHLWNTRKKFRIMNGPLIDDNSHVRWK